MNDDQDLYRNYNPQMEDFWDRRANLPLHHRTIRVFGQSVTFHSNREKALECAQFAERQYSSAAETEATAWNINLVVHDPIDPPGPPPRNLIDLVHYAGAEDWLSIGLAEWGTCFVDMANAQAHAVISAGLAERPELVSQVLINTILTNLITRNGFSMLHASALVKDARILLLQAPHGTGKSTTALRLLMNGFKLLSDSMVYVGEQARALWMGGFPVGRIKLRADMVPNFPEFAALADPEPVRGEIKQRVELDNIDPSLTIREMIQVGRVEFCLLERWNETHSAIEPLAPAAIWPKIMMNSLHYDKPALWQENLSRIDLLLQHSRLHILRIGSIENSILETVQKLWDDRD